MDVASMGWIAVGMGRLTEPSKPLTTEDAEDTEEFFNSVGVGDLGLFSESIFSDFFVFF